MARVKTDEKAASATNGATGQGRPWSPRRPVSMPTQVGDVLMLWTNQTFTTYAVGLVSKNGQRDFCGQTPVAHERDRAAAIAKATALVLPGHRIVLCSMDTGVWSEISLPKRQSNRQHRHDLLSHELARSA
jgi:hypothetical protein